MAHNTQLAWFESQEPESGGCSVSKSVRTILFGAATMLAASVASPAFADTMICNSLTSCSYNLDDFIGTGSPPPGPYGTSNLTQSGANVDVSVSLASGNVFAKTGAGEAFLWDFHNDPSLAGDVVFTGGSAGNFTFDPNPGHKDGSGSWDYGIICSACGNGTSPPDFTNLTFEIKNATLSEFVRNGKGYDLTSDLGIACTNGGGCYTGDVVAHPGGGGNVPEPASVALLCSGVAAAGVRRRRRQKKRS
jgi:hypothetical protein